jgi:EamA domain-containing membrane protein RarD
LETRPRRFLLKERADRWLAAAMAISVAAVVLPAQASDELPSSAAALAFAF